MELPFPEGLHWYWYVAGSPPEAVAVNVTRSPGHTFRSAEAVTCIGGNTCIVIGEEVAAGPLQGSVLVTVTVTISPCCNAPDVKVDVLLPAFTPFISHW